MKTHLLPVGLGAALMLAVSATQISAHENDLYGKTTILLDKATKNNIGQPLAYRSDFPAAITSMIVPLEPGQKIRKHLHVVPVYAYVLEGEITLTYEGDKTRTYKQGEAFLEATNTWHYGVNNGKEPARILAVFLGAEGLPNAIPQPESGQ
ncbi:cupin domain-containing protein [Flexibacterium corallicola]|uniref:cupin domain-containing protein n=1 Tax=Flexibacterium corallicola TaxID=3037259 RepID=UPI00286F9509|nr:cupin domain-containing protein [Pseudovibrio sp. M1P-2-3]